MKSLDEIRKNFKWPKRKDNPFKIDSRDPGSPDWISLEPLYAPKEQDDVIYAEAFKRAGSVLIKHITSQNNKINPSYIDFMPITFMYRHCIELKLKKIVKLGLKLRLIGNGKDINEALKSHKLSKIWDHACKTIKLYWPNDNKDDIRGATGIINAFDRIDKSGLGMRYPISLDGNSSLNNLPKAISLPHMQNVIEGLCNFLDASIDGLLDGLDHMECQ